MLLLILLPRGGILSPPLFSRDCLGPIPGVLLIPNLVELAGGRWGRGVTALGELVNTTLGEFVEEKVGGAALEARVSALACPIALAGGAQGNVVERVVLADRMFLAALDVLRPVTAVGILMVQQTPDAELFRSSAVPARPVAGAGRLVPEDAVQGTAVVGLDGGVGNLLVVKARGPLVARVRPLAVGAPPGVVTPRGDAPIAPHEHQAVGAIIELRGLVHTLPVSVAVLCVPHHTGLNCARVHLSEPPSSPLGPT